MTPPKNLRDLSPSGLEQLVLSRGYERFRADQIMDWLYRRSVTSLAQMKNLPARLREDLVDYGIGLPLEDRRLSSQDGAVKLGFRLWDNELVESVWMPGEGRVTLCLSTQAGCRMACRFCRTGSSGFRRHLSPGEMVGQVIVSALALGPIDNLVFMGMGEPLDNLDNLLAALAILTHKRGPGPGAKHITVSTIGNPEAISRFASLAPPVNLAVSLHSAVVETRAALMPAAFAKDLTGLRAALGRYPLTSRGRLTLEIALIGAVNDSPAEARAVARWLAGLPAKVNLIRFNPFPESDFKAPLEQTVLDYQQVLRGKGVPAFIRQSRGADILAGCGQLLSTE